MQQGRGVQRVLCVMAAVLTITTAHAATFRLRSGDLKGGTLARANEYRGSGCSGRNESPALSWSGAPRGTRSFVLTVYDENAAHLTQSGWWHWVLVNIPASTHHLARNAGHGSGPDGSQEVLTDFGVPGYGGPCPPPGDGPHHYLFTLYALKVAHLPVSATTTGAAVTYMARHAALGSATLVASFSR